LNIAWTFFLSGLIRIYILKTMISYLK